MRLHQAGWLIYRLLPQPIIGLGAEMRPQTGAAGLHVHWTEALQEGAQAMRTKMVEATAAMMI